MFNFAVERDQIKVSPAAGVKAPPKGPPRKRVLINKDSDEIAGMFRAVAASAMHPGMKLAMEFQLLTAQRPGAVRGALWFEIDLEKRTWTVAAERMKRRKQGDWADLPNVVPLSTQALAVLERARTLSGDSDFLFPGRDPKKPWSPEAIDHELHRDATLKKLKEHGVGRFNLHDLRRTATTIMTGSGVAPHIVDRVLGHVPQGVTAEVYDQYEYSPEKRAALDTLGVRVAAMKAGLRIVAPAALG
jgi:integrase